MTRLQTIGYVLARIAAPVFIVALGVGSLIVFGQKPEQEERPETAEPATIVEVVDVKAFDGEFTIEVEGVALPLRQVQTSAQVSGIVKWKSPQCRGGRYVKAGESLIQIDATDYELEQKRLQAQLDQANETLAEVGVDISNTKDLITLAEEEAALQQRNLARVQNLQRQGASTETLLDDAKKQELATRNVLQTLQNSLRSQQQKQKSQTAAARLANAQLQQAGEDIVRTKIAAPLSGTIVTTDVEEGDYVKVGDPLFRINDTDNMEVSCQLRVEELYWIWMQAGTFDQSQTRTADVAFEIPNAPVEVVFDFKGVEYLWNGKLSRYEGTGLDPNTRTVPARVLVESPTDVRIGGDGVAGLVAPPALFSGMYVKVRIPVDPPIPLIEVPTIAVQPGGEVWLARDGALDIEPVKVARTHGEAALLLPSPGGPRPGDRIVISPLAGPSQGMQVQAINPNSPVERAAAEAATNSADQTDSTKGTLE